MKRAEAAGTVEKAIQVLLTLSQTNGELGTNEISRRVGIHKATASRILVKLAEHDFVYKSKETRKYWLGPAIHQLGMTIAEASFKRVLQIARSHIDEIRENTSETTTLEIWLGNSTVPTYIAESRQALKVALPPGEVLPLHAAAGAKAILAFSHRERVELLLSEKLEALTANTITDKARLLERLDEYFQQGYAIDDEEVHPGISAVAVPVFNHIRQPIAALVVLTPTSRFSTKVNSALVSELKQRAKRMTEDFSLRGAPTPSSFGLAGAELDSHSSN